MRPVMAADQEVEFVGSRRVPFAVQSEQDKMLRYHVSLLSHCLNDGLDPCSEYQVSRLPLGVSRVKAKDRLGAFEQLKTWGEGGFWRVLPARGKSGALLSPNIPVAGGVRALFGAGELFGPPRVFPEVRSQPAVVRKPGTHKPHITKLQQVCDMKAIPRCRGVPNAAALPARK